MIKKQLFIFGNPRSGTSLLRLILNAHSLISIPPECGFFLWLYSKYQNWSALNLESSQINQFIKDLQNCKKIESWQLTNGEFHDIINLKKPLNYLELIQCVYLTYAHKHKKNPEYVGDKNNYYLNHLDDIDTITKNYFAIHIIRDGRDIVNSYRKIETIPDTFIYKPKLPTAIADISHQWVENNMTIYNHLSDRENYAIIRYEDLVEKSQQTLEILLDKINLGFEPNMLNFYIENQQHFIEPKETLAWKQKTLQPLDASDIGKFNKNLTASEIDEFNKTGKTTLNLFGYDA